MQIECYLERAEGTFVQLGETIYHFFTAGNAKGDTRHTCEVTDPDHIQTFLAIKEAYRPVAGQPGVAKAKAPAPAADPAPASTTAAK
jgi:hypothetical protein